MGQAVAKRTVRYYNHPVHPKRMAAFVSLRIFTLHNQVWSYLHSTFGGSPAVTKLQACQYCLAAAHAEQVVISKPLEVLQLLTR